MDVSRGRGAKKLNWPEICCKALSKLFSFFSKSLQVALRWPKMRPKMAKMRAKNAWMRPMIAKMRLKMAMMVPFGAS